ncbi:MAG: metal-dependent transcriptional regulator [Intrasporangium sp.]|uniref:metal-dependent transcriptional regulator n=1 Tax=Intrasporangium sp. TaxID=1925024 RepID=UPI002647614B|nr:metal-dependent transcriptional regulator [Intrasporangium sp.]MDN5794357.1 metal-dependent transcriptional regulator [Intrasporangium sp.]
MTDLIDTTEMYLRTIYELEEEGIVPLRARIAERLGHSGPTVSQTVGRMERDGLVSVTGDRHLELSTEGRLRAMRVMRKHRLAERLLVDVIGLEWEYAHEEACRWEHVMSEQVERKILHLIGEGRESPYGNPIPGLDEFGVAAGEDFRAGLVMLPEAMAPGGDDALAEVTIRRIGEPVQVDPAALALLTTAGVLPGARVVLRPAEGGVSVIRAGADPDSGVTLPGEVAAHVFCEPARS